MSRSICPPAHDFDPDPRVNAIPDVLQAWQDLRSQPAMRMVLVELIAWALPEESYQVLYIPCVRLGPHVFIIFWGNSLKRHKKKQALSGKKFDHLTQLKRVARRT